MLNNVQRICVECTCEKTPKMGQMYVLTIKSNPIRSEHINCNPNPIRVQSDRTRFGLGSGSDLHASALEAKRLKNFSLRREFSHD